MISRVYSFRSLLVWGLFGFLLLHLIGCGLYVPTLGPTSMVQARGQAEVGGFYRPLVMGEVYAAYSPLNHLLVAGSASRAWDVSGGDTKITFHQVDAALGYYTVLGREQHWYISGLGGYGRARTHSRFETSSSASASKVYSLRYNPAYGQAQFAFQHENFALGTVLRLTSLRYTELEFNGQAPTGAVGDLYLGNYWYMRAGSGPIQLQIQVGASRPLPAAQPHMEYELNTSSPIMGIGLLLRPHLLSRGTQVQQRP
ncbi:hypothetical protein ASU33_12750 [Solirubrum puertoriconensis]|uniref:Uncharacterized protein n=1 Tax=Solirubrum puertoriconensis TaxID=1751427 RepID=A0A9X0HK26_SOLP1|nr:hypothetical protein ASU33_12750 [Solirubrum puertoriconensis]